MKNITLSAKDDTIAGLRAVAARQNTTVNDLFRAWADELTAREERLAAQKMSTALQKSVRRINYVKLDRKYTRTEMNQR